MGNTSQAVLGYGVLIDNERCTKAFYDHIHEVKKMYPDWSKPYFYCAYDQGYGCSETFIGECIANEKRFFGKETTLELKANPQIIEVTMGILKKFSLDDLELGWIFMNYD